jgi:hypothetical protein
MHSLRQTDRQTDRQSNRLSNKFLRRNFALDTKDAKGFLFSPTIFS